MIGSRQLFPQLQDRVYLAHAGISPPSQPVQQAVQRVLRDIASVGAEAVPEILAMRARLKQRLAQLLSCSAQDLALTTGTSWGVLAVAQNFPWRAGQRLALVRGEFPTNISPWLGAAQQFGLEVVWLEPDLEGLERELRQGLTLLAMSAVQFQSGRRMPWEEVTPLCHRYECQVFIDAIQAAGVVPIAVADIDYLAGGSHKWLMGVEGCGYLYVRPERLAQLEPRWRAWLSHQDPVGFLFQGAGHLDYHRPLREDAAFLEIGSSSALSQTALDASLEILLDIGIDNIHRHVNAYLDQLEPHLVDLGWTSHRGTHTRSGILALQKPGDLAATAQHLGQAGVRVSTPDGHLRLAPHWPNSAQGEIDHVVQAFTDLAHK